MIKTANGNDSGNWSTSSRSSLYISIVTTNLRCFWQAGHYIHKVTKDVRSCVSLSDQDFSIENSENLEIFMCDINLKIFRYMRAEC